MKQAHEAGGSAGANGLHHPPCCEIVWRCLGYLKLDGLYLAAALAVRSSGQGHGELSGERGSLRCVALLSGSSDFQVILCLLGLMSPCLKSRPPISALSPTFLVHWGLSKVKQVLLTEIAKPAASQHRLEGCILLSAGIFFLFP